MPRSQQQVFVIRVWLESMADGTTVSRGYVEHVASGERRYFVDPADALDYVAAVGRNSLRADTAKAGRCTRGAVQGGGSD